MKFSIVVIALSIAIRGAGQTTNTATMDTTDFPVKGTLTVQGYIDSYYAFNFNEPSSGDQPYFVSMARHNELTINLAYIDIKYTGSIVRARFVPGFGTYINENYAAETGVLKNIVEASAGIKLSTKRGIWLDAGVFGSPYTNESAISKDHLAYTRSFAPEYVPYYLSGLKLTVPLSAKVNLYAYVINGWQQIVDQNKYKSIGTQLELRLTDKLLLNWNTYLGKERSAGDSTIGNRIFSDVYFIYSGRKFSATGCIYGGLQDQAGDRRGEWWQANIIGRYNLTEKLSVTGRLEYFNDPDQVQIVPVTDVQGFSSYSSSLGINYFVADNAMVRLEGRTFFSDDNVYIKNETAVSDSNTITANITVWF
jgi:hypothetical protein